MIHVPVSINKDENKGRETTQRTRSFLYASLGSIVASSVNAGGVRFFERSSQPESASRRRGNTGEGVPHYAPDGLHYFGKFFSMVLERKFVFDNPFLFKTKAEVVSLIGTNNSAELVGLTCSCSHPMFQSKTRWHCGTCSQCIDRRLAVLAAKLDQYDEDHDYETDVSEGHGRRATRRTWPLTT